MSLITWKTHIVKDAKTAKELEDLLNEKWDISPLVPPRDMDGSCLFILFKQSDSGIVSPMSSDIIPPMK